MSTSQPVWNSIDERSFGGTQCHPLEKCSIQTSAHLSAPPIRRAENHATSSARISPCGRHAGHVTWTKRTAAPASHPERRKPLLHPLRRVEMLHHPRQIGRAHV